MMKLQYPLFRAGLFAVCAAASVHCSVANTDGGEGEGEGETGEGEGETGEGEGDTGEGEGESGEGEGETGEGEGETGEGEGETGEGEGEDPSDLPAFSFFVTSLDAIVDLSGSPDGFGGDLRYGETGPGAGLRGADKICGDIAERSMPGASAKNWHAFLSATDDGDGNVVHAIDRISGGPWYDRTGRLFANNKSELLFDRPQNADSDIIDDFPNEDGVPNHQPDPNQPEVDNHDMLTGTDEAGELYSATATCADWTGATGDEGRPRVGHSWPRYGGPGGGGGGGGGGGPGGNINMANWMSSLDEAGCAAGIRLEELGPPVPGENTVGSGGGYGGFYCFAELP